MAFKSFSVGPSKSLTRARCDDVPNLMIICGPNGVGKSTLLYLLKNSAKAQAEPGTDVIYMGPHRAWRRSSIRPTVLLEQPKYTFSSFLALDSLPSLSAQGLQYIHAFPRTPDSTDESSALVKFAILRLEERRRDRITDLFEKGGGAVEQGSLPDIWEPLRTLITYLLPHLVFCKIDKKTNPDDIKCLFARRDMPSVMPIDIDDLSSGEKAIISLFLPFLEHQILRVLEAEGDPSGVVPTAIIDEPDLHLHPSLQVAFLAYLRDLASEGQAQFILTTHSPTLIDAANEEELFLLAPPSAVVDENQLIRVASSVERLEALREIMGSTHMVTRCRPIVFVEGHQSASLGKLSDQGLIQALIPESRKWVVVPSGGRSETIRTATRLRAALPDGLPGIPAFCLVDRDRGSTEDPDWAISWPVATIENLLLDPALIYGLLEPYSDGTNLRSEEDVRRALNEIAEAREEDEVRVRVREWAPALRLEFEDYQGDSMSQDLLKGAREKSEEWCDDPRTSEELEKAIAAARSEVGAIGSEGRRLEAFRGKEILRTFFDTYAKRLYSFSAFCTELARRGRESPRVRRLTETAVAKVSLYVPAALLSAVDQLLDTDLPAEWQETAAAAKATLAAARREFEEARHDGVDRMDLRRNLLQLIRGLEAAASADERLREARSAVARYLVEVSD